MTFFQLLEKGGGSHLYVGTCVCVCVCVLVVHSCLTVTSWTIGGHAPLSMEFSRQEYWSGYPFPSPGDLPDPEDLLVSCLAGRFFTV